MDCKNCEENKFQTEREKFNWAKGNQKSQDCSSPDDLRKVEHPEPFDFFGGNDQK